MNISPPTKPQKTLQGDTRGITWTIEAFLSVTLLLGVLFFTLTSFPAPDPGAQQIAAQEIQLQQTGQDILSGLDGTNELQSGLFYVDVTDSPDNQPAWHDPEDTRPDSQSDYASFPTNHPYSSAFGFLTENNVLYNLEMVYQEDTSTTSAPVPVVYQGVPGQNAVVVEYTTIVEEDTAVRAENGAPLEGECGVAAGEEVTISDAEESGSCNMYMDNVFTGGDTDFTSRYNVVRLRLTLWK